jgi:POT family proton-dependent oligopeptide transporter
MSQPKALYLLSTVQLWKFFSHYGNKVLLVLYMVQAMNMRDSDAFALYAVYGAMFELGGIFGGIAADRLLGLRRAVMLGGWLMAAGHLCMAFENNFSLGLAFIVVGSSFFSTNIAALLGQFYKKDDPLRDKGFTLFYMVMNLGAMISTIICPLLASVYGWHAGFGLAAIGMLIANLLLFTFRSVLDGKGELGKRKNKTPLLIFSFAAIGICQLVFTKADFFLPLLPGAILGLFLWMAIKIRKEGIGNRKMINFYFVCLAALVGFFSMQEQIGSSLIMFAERMVSKTIWGIEVPSTLLMSINPLVIILLGAVVSVVCASLGSTRLPVGFLLGAISFGFLAFFVKFSGELSYGLVAAAVILLSVAELMIGPYVYSFSSQVAAKGNPGTVMGMLPIGFSCASLLGGALSNIVAVDGAGVITSTYAAGFTMISLGAIIAAAALIFLNKKYGYQQSPIHS